MGETIKYDDLLAEAGVSKEDFDLAVTAWPKRMGGTSWAKSRPKPLRVATLGDEVQVFVAPNSVIFFKFKTVDALVKALKKRLEKMKESPVTKHERIYYARVNKHGHYWMGKGRYSKNLDWKKLPTWVNKPGHPPDEKLVKVRVKVEVIGSPSTSQDLKTYVWSMAWTEPSQGTHATVCRLTQDEANQIHELFDWLKEHAGAEWGHTLASMTLEEAQEASGGVRFGPMMEDVITQARYNEYDEPGTYYGARNALLDEHLKET
jgi:hypothetical protein